MKRYLYILAACFAMYSCDKTVIDGGLPANVGGKNSIEVVKSSIIFSPDVSEGYVLVRTDGPVTARSTRSWCTVECFGDSVAVKTTSNYDDLDSRYAQVIVYHQGDSVALNVHQEGPLTASFDDSAVVLGHEGGDAEFAYRSNMIAEVTSDVSWATVEAERNVVKVHVRRNNTEEYRAGELTCRLGNVTYKVTVAQLDPTEILSRRNWKLDGVLMDGTKLSLTGVLSKLGANYTMTLTGTGISWSFPATVTKNQLNIPLGTSIGRYEADGRNYHIIPAVGEGENVGTETTLATTGTVGLEMLIDRNTGKWQGNLNMKPFISQFTEPVFRFEYWLNSYKGGQSSGGFRFRELTIAQQ